MVVASAVGGLQVAGLALGVRPEELGLTTACLLVARGPLWSPRQRWLETSLAATMLLYGAALDLFGFKGGKSGGVDKFF